MTEERRTVQLQTWAVCQLCGYGVPIGEATPKDGWLVGVYKQNPEFNVVRCPRHISEWSLRNSVGRTTEWRKRMKNGKRWRPPIGWELSPLPMFD